MFYHGYSVSRALLDLFPDIGLDKSKLGKCMNICIYIIFIILLFYYFIIL